MVRKSLSSSQPKSVQFSRNFLLLTFMDKFLCQQILSTNFVIKNSIPTVVRSWSNWGCKTIHSSRRSEWYHTRPPIRPWPNHRRDANQKNWSIPVTFSIRGIVIGNMESITLTVWGRNGAAKNVYQDMAILKIDLNQRKRLNNLRK